MSKKNFRAKRRFQRAVKSRPYSASEFNRLTDDVSRLMDPDHRNQRKYPRIYIVRMDETIGPKVTDAAQFRDKTGTIRGYQTGGNEGWTDTAIQKQVYASHSVPYDINEIVPVAYLNGRHIPLSATHVRHAITVSVSGSYPAITANPNTYAIKWIKLTYSEAAGNQTPTMTYLDSGTGTPASAVADDYVLNIQKMGSTYAYIPEGQLIACYYCQGAWFTDYHAVVYKPNIRFRLTQALTVADSTKLGTILNQWGLGINNPNTGAGAITLYNHESSSAGVYSWEGDVSDTGIASWDSGNNYRIMFMECP